MPLELRLIHRDVLDPRRRDTRVVGDQTIHQRKGIAMRQQTSDLFAGQHNIRRRGFSHKAAARSVWSPWDPLYTRT